MVSEELKSKIKAIIDKEDFIHLNEWYHFEVDLSDDKHGFFSVMINGSSGEQCNETGDTPQYITGLTVESYGFDDNLAVENYVGYIIPMP